MAAPETRVATIFQSGYRASSADTRRHDRFLNYDADLILVWRNFSWYSFTLSGITLLNG